MYAFVAFVCRFVVGIVFIFAGYFKIRAGRKWFHKMIQSYKLTNQISTAFLALTLPYTEVLLGLLLISGLFLWSTTLISLLLLMLFNFAIFLVHGQSKNVDCGCFGKSNFTNKDSAKKKIIVRNSIMSGILLFNLFVINPERFLSYVAIDQILLLLIVLSIFILFILIGIKVISNKITA